MEHERIRIVIAIRLRCGEENGAMISQTEIEISRVSYDNITEFDDVRCCIVLVVDG